MISLVGAPGFGGYWGNFLLFTVKLEGEPSNSLEIFLEMKRRETLVEQNLGEDKLWWRITLVGARDLVISLL